jgi:hypothetical protein
MGYLKLVRDSYGLSMNITLAPKSFDKTSNILFQKYCLENKLLESSLELKKQETLLELTQDLYNTSSDQRLQPLMDSFVRLELLDWWRRNSLDSSGKKGF